MRQYPPRWKPRGRHYFNYICRRQSPFRPQDFRRPKKRFPARIGILPSLALNKPIGEKLHFDVGHAIVAQDLFHLLQRSLSQDMPEVRVPYAETLESCPCRGPDAILEIEAAVVSGIVREDSRASPI